MPFLIYAILKANTLEGVKINRLYSNVMYVSRYRSEDKVRSEAGYYLTCINAAIGFIVNLQYDSLTWPAPEDA